VISAFQLLSVPAFDFVNFCFPLSQFRFLPLRRPWPLTSFQLFSVLVFQLLFCVSLCLPASAQTNGASSEVITSPTGLHVVSGGAPAASPDIPSLNWQPRSDWINVKSNVSPVAIGDGVADDTAALQAALSMTNVGKTVYLPPGTYRITQTLAMHGPGPGSAIIGNGRDTSIVWDGTNGGVMFWSDGIAYSRYIGLSWDGGGKAAVGFDHASTNIFETEVQHVNEAFRNFTAYGIRVGNNQQVASAEILYRNCLFTNCGTAIGLLTFNDYNNTIDHCEFENCGTGVSSHKSNFYARNSHFANSSNVDFFIGAEHGCSIRRCTSTDSKQFVYAAGTIAPITLQDCQVADWTAPDTAVYVNGSPVLIFDCVFTNGPSNSVPINSQNSSQDLLLCNNSPAQITALVSGISLQHIYIIPKGTQTGVVTNASQRFLLQTAAVPGKTFDAKRDFGAKGDGQTDDSTSIQSALNAAMQYGQGAMAYLPTGAYVVSKTLSVTGSNYTMGGSGFRCGLMWRGQAGAPIITVSNVQNVTMADFCAGHHDFGLMTNGDDVWITSSPNQPCQLTIDGVYVYGIYDLNPNAHGMHFDSLPAGSVVTVPKVQGNLWITNCAQATLLFRTSYEGTATIRGTSAANNIPGFLTRMATITDPALQVFDNQSVVISDFYVEQSDQIAVFTGAPGQSQGTVTIQSPKAEMSTTNMPIFDIKGYAGRIYYGQVEFYCQPVKTIFQSSDAPSLQLILAGEFWYNNSPVFDLNPAVTPTLLGNSGAADSGVTPAAMAALSNALDDLRKLGQLDSSL
jgi:hypothetical protein